MCLHMKLLYMVTVLFLVKTGNMLPYALIATTWLIISLSLTLGHIFDRFVRSLRIASGAPHVFVQSTVWAEMRKSVSYRVDISLNEDGIVQETQCECGAGQGPTAHCKHVVTVLFGLTCFSATGDVLTELTCTQVS